MSDPLLQEAGIEMIAKAYPLAWPLGLRSSCVPALLYPQPRSATV
jgi:hypothetical protein